MGEFGIHAGAGCCQRLDNRGSFERAVDQHATGRVGGFAAGFTALDNYDSSPTFAQGDGKREADDAPADDDYVPSLHLGIVKEAGCAQSSQWERG